MTEYGVTDTGFVLKDYDTILADLQAEARVRLGEDIDLSDESPLGEFLKVIAYEFQGMWEQLENTYYAGFLNSATGQSLDRVVALVGVERRAATYATGTIRFSASAAVSTAITIPAGTRVQTADRTLTFATNAAATIAVGQSYVDVAVTAVATGIDGNVAAGTTTYLYDPVAGVTTVTNPAATTGGSDIESDASLRYRAQNYAPDAAATVIAFEQRLLGLDGVLSVAIAEDTDTNAVTVTVLGGTDSEITALLNLIRPCGISVSWNRPTTDTVVVTCTVTVQDGSTASAVLENVAAALDDYLNDLGIAENVYFSEVVEAITGANGVKLVTVCSVTRGEDTINTFGSTITIADGHKAVPGTHVVTQG